eukprot:5734870-Pyramimonas_sp.AAC.1
MRAVALGLRWGAPETLCWVGDSAKLGVWGTHAGGPTGGFGGVPYWATKRCTVWAKMPNWMLWTHVG